MTDIETIRAMLKQAGLEFSEGTRVDDKITYMAIIIEDKGYPGFLSEFWFDQSGALKHIAAWE